MPANGKGRNGADVTTEGAAVHTDVAAFCLADQTFYDSPGNADGPAGRFAEADKRPPAGWVRVERAGRARMSPPEHLSPDQGWLIHVTATPANARRVLSQVWRHCVSARLAFAFAVGPSALLASGPPREDATLATVYPVSDQELRRALGELGRLLAHEPGPPVPGAPRWREGPLFTRYGAFASQHVWDGRDQRVRVLRDPDGNLAPDRPRPGLSIPDWVSTPAFLRTRLAASAAGDVLAALPYQIQSTARCWAGGATHHAVAADGRAVLVKQAFPHAGWDAAGADAASRLRREGEVLRHLAGLRCVPTVLDALAVDGHEFLVLERPSGRSLADWRDLRNPLLFPTGAPMRPDAYAAWAMRAHATLSAAVAKIHARGVVVGHLRPDAIWLDEHGAVRITDFELAASVDEARGRPGACGYLAPPDREGFAVDEYALAAIRLGLFLPLTAMTRRPPRRAGTLVAEVTAHFPAPAHLFATAVRTLAPTPAWTERPAAAAEAVIERVAAGTASWAALRDGLVQGILRTATFERADRLFPGSPAQFAPGGGLSLATGAAGVLYALHAAGARPPAAAEDWLTRAADQTVDLPVGLYDGLHGVSHVLRLLGRRQDADRLLERALATPAAHLPTGLFHGIAGVGLHLADLAARTGDVAAYQAAEAMVTHAADRLADPNRDLDRPGLLRGWAGVGLLFLRWWQLTGDDTLLALARTALRRDLDRCQLTPAGKLHAGARPGQPPCLDGAGGGVGVVLDEYLAVAPDERFAAARAAAIRTACGVWFPHPGLLNGRAGMLLFLTRRRRPPLDKAVAAHLRRLAWHLTPYQDGLAVPGPGLARLSADLATGAAGVLLAAARAHGLTAADLPLTSLCGQRGADPPLLMHAGCPLA